MTDHQIIIEFGKGISPDVQGKAMLALEKMLREQGLPVVVLKHTMPDDNKSRRLMTLEQRDKL